MLRKLFLTALLFTGLLGCTQIMFMNCNNEQCVSISIDSTVVNGTVIVLVLDNSDISLDRNDSAALCSVNEFTNDEKAGLVTYLLTKGYRIEAFEIDMLHMCKEQPFLRRKKRYGRL